MSIELTTLTTSVEFLSGGPIAAPFVATKARTDDEVLTAWLANLHSAHTRRNFEKTGRRFLALLGCGLREARVEDVRRGLEALCEGVAPSSGRQYVIRAKSLLSWAHAVGYLPFNAGRIVKLAVVEDDVDTSVGNPGLAKRILSEIQVPKLLTATLSTRDRIMLNQAYAGGLRASELVVLTWGDAIEVDGGLIQLHVAGKRRRVRQVLLPETVSIQLRTLRGDAPSTAPTFSSRMTGKPRKDGRPSRHRPGHLTERGVWDIVKRSAKRAGLSRDVSTHWLRHEHASHAIRRGSTVVDVQMTLGHSNIRTTSEYLHARPEDSSGLRLDIGVFAPVQSKSAIS